MILFKILWGIDAVATLVIVYFFFVGLADGTVSASNAGLWLLIVAALGIVMYGSIWLQSHGHPKLALALLLVIFIPAILFALYFGVAIATNARWN